MGWKSIGRTIRKGAEGVNRLTGGVATGGPLAYLGGVQQHGFQGGADQYRANVNNPGDFWSSPQNRSMMALTAAEVAAIVGSAGTFAAAPGTVVGGTTLATGGTIAATPAISTALAAGALAAGAGTRRITGESGGGSDSSATPPDINEANDPAMAAQFQRIRKAGRALGRAGTIKNKTSSSLGLGDQLLGDQLSLIGS